MRFNSDSVMDERTLREIYLTAFEIAVKEGRPSTVMCAYNKVNGEHCSDSKKLLTDILRKEWGYDGIVVTDWGAMGDRIAGFEAGCDLNMPGGSDYMESEVEQAVKEGRIKESVIDENVDRMLDLILKCAANRRPQKTSFNHEEHHALARHAAEEGIVLLKNEEVLPLKEGQKIAVIGAMAGKIRYQGAGSSHINPTSLTQPLEVMGDVSYAEGCDEKGNTSDSLLIEAREAAAAADVAIVFAGLTEKYESEGFDRDNIRMPEGHLQMIREVVNANPNTIVVLMCGSVVACPWADQVKGILYAGLSGQAGAEAIANILYGRVNPSGKLAETWPLAYEDCPSAGYYGKKNAQYREGLYIGYRYYDTANVAVRWPFGYGLSYTTFAYSDLQVEGNQVKATVTNTGNIAGKEVVQLYIAAQTEGPYRPRKELKGFDKIELAAGESRQVHFTLDERSFAIWNDGWVVPEGNYTILVGGSSDNLPLSQEISRKGAHPETPSWQKDSWYEKPQGGPTQEEWEKMLGHKYVETARHKGTYTMDDTVEEMQKDAWIMKIMYKAIEMVVKQGMKKKEDSDEAELKMMMASSAGSPLRSMQICGGIKGGVMKGMLEIANGHFFRGLGTMIGIVK